VSPRWSSPASPTCPIDWLAEAQGDLNAADFRAGHAEYWASVGMRVTDDTLVVQLYFDLDDDGSSRVSSPFARPARAVHDPYVKRIEAVWQVASHIQHPMRVRHVRTRRHPAALPKSLYHTFPVQYQVCLGVLCLATVIDCFNPESSAMR
jgi:hypothetical protein